MGKKNSVPARDSSDMNVFLFAQYSKYLKPNEKNSLLDLSNAKLMEEDSACQCFGFRDKSNNNAWKDHFSESFSFNNGKNQFRNEIKNFCNYLSYPNMSYYLSKLSWKIFQFLNSEALDLRKNNKSFSNEREETSTIYNDEHFSSFLLSEMRSACPNYDKEKKETNLTIEYKSAITRTISFRKDFKPNSLVNSRIETICCDLNEESQKIKMEDFHLYKKITEEIENHLNSPNNCLGELKNYFLNHFLNKFSSKKNEEINSEENNRNNFKEIVKEFKFFLKVFTETLMIFYKIEHIAECRRKTTKSQTNYLNYENFYVFITNICFTPEIYNILFRKHVKYLKGSFDKIFSLNKNNIELLTMEKLEIAPEFRLTEPGENEKCYIKTIEMLKGIENLRSPFLKFKLINNVSENILKEVHEYYCDKNNKIPNNIDTDNLVALHIYIVAKCGVEDIAAHFNFIEQFMSNKHKCTISGYYLTLFMAGLEYLEKNC